MNIIKRILLAPVPWFEKHGVQDGQFTDRARRITRLVLAISIVTLVADPVLSLIRFGYPGFSHPAYYVCMLGLILAIALITRPNAETSLVEMKQSKNWVMRGVFYLMWVGVVTVEWLIDHWPKFDRAMQRTDDVDEPLYPPIGSDGMRLSEPVRMAQYIDDMAAPPSWPH